MRFEKFEDVGKSYAPVVTIRSAGQIGLLTGAVNRFELFFSRSSIGLLTQTADSRPLGEA